MIAAQLSLAVGRWQETPGLPTKYAIPWPGSEAVVLLSTAASQWRPKPTRVRVLGVPVSTGCGRRAYAKHSDRPESLIYMHTVLCRVPGEKRPRPIAVERFPKLEVV